MTGVQRQGVTQGWGVNKRIDVGTILAVAAILFAVWQSVNAKLNTLADLVISDKENRQAIAESKRAIADVQAQLNKMDRRGERIATELKVEP